MARKKIVKVTDNQEAELESKIVQQPQSLEADKAKPEQPEADVSTPTYEDEPQPPAPIPEPPPKPRPLTMASLKAELDELRALVQAQSTQIADMRSLLALKRKPTKNARIQIRDKETGRIYPSKNNAYQSLLKSGELKELVDKGIFGPNPAKNNFGWFTLNRAYADRFEEVKPDSEKV
jgi:hypothetical protein